MPSRSTTVCGYKSIGGIALAVLGLFMFYKGLASAVDGFRHILGINGSGAIGTLPALALALSRASRDYAADHPHFVRTLLRHAVPPCWSLLLVRSGTLLSREAFLEAQERSQEKDGANVDSAIARSTSK